MRAGGRVPQKRADFLVEFGADDVLELTSVRIRFGFGNRKSIGQQSFCEPPPPNDVASPCAASLRQSQLAFAHGEQPQRLKASDDARRILSR